MKVLVLAPRFHGYSKALADAMGARGHDVSLWHYDDLPTIRSKVHHKLRHELPDRRGGTSGFTAIQKATTASALEVVTAHRPDVLLVIKGDVLTADFWHDAKPHVGLRHLWLYDEVRRMRHGNGVFDAVDRLSTYSRLDQQRLTASGQECGYVPNAFDAALGDAARNAVHAFLFVGARYPNRADLLTHLNTRSVPVLAVGRDWSHHPYDRLRTWQWDRPPVPSRRDVSRREAYGLMAGAIGNLNSHFDQDGFTMRTFEIPGMGGLQLIDRADVSEFYEPDEEVLVYRSLDELAELCHRAMRDRAWATSIGTRARRRTLAEHTFAQRVPLLEEQWA